MATGAQVHRIRQERLEALLRSMQRDTVPTLARVQEDGDVSILEIGVLQTLDHDRPPFHGDPTVKDLAAVLGRSRSHTSRLVDRMVRRGLVERYEDAVDRRVRRVRLDEEGRAVLSRIARVRTEALSRLWIHLTEGELDTVMAGMELLAEATHRMTEARDVRDRPE